MAFVAAGIIGGAGVVGSVVTGLMGMSAAEKARREAARRAAIIQGQISTLEANRQKIINPYANVKDTSYLAKDLSSMLSNPYQNLGVATKSAEFEAEQIDLSLANTLDTLRETGSSAGGATALAQAALKSKQGVSANLEQQEVQNDKLRAQGQAELQQQKMAEAQRLQNVQMSEAQRLQQADVAGQQFVWQGQENRDIAQLNRLSSQLGGAQQQQMQANADYTGALTGMIGGVVGAGAQFAAAGISTNWGKTEPSDRRLKRNIKTIGISPSGINIYSFEYKYPKFGNGVFQGVMSDEVPLNAVVKGADGYDRVDYSMLDVEFKQIQ